MYRMLISLLIVCLFVNTAAALPGSGTQADPWRIQSLSDFDEFAADANYWAGCIRLKTDIDLAGRIYTTAVIAPDTDNDYWSLFDGPAFTGFFDGNGKKIINLTIDDGGLGNRYLGLFGCIDEGEVRNLGFEDVSIFGAESYDGCLTGAIYYGSISNCFSTGSVSGDGYVGGLLGMNWDGSISNCYFVGSVNSYSGVGGLMGRNSGSVLNCYSAADVTGNRSVGGLVGQNDGSISNCYSTGDVNGVLFVGGLVGKNDYGIVSNCFWDIETQSHSVTESIGLNYRGIITNVSGLPTTQMQAISTFTEVGWDFLGERDNGTTETWQMPAGGGYPVLSVFHVDIPLPLVGNGTTSEPYLVSDANELGMVSWYSADCHFTLTGDIDLSGINWSIAVIPVFNGCFDGDGHKVLNVQISGGDYLGLFGYLGTGGQVRNLDLESSSISGHEFVGGLAGVNIGNIKNCYSTGDVDGLREVGSLVGRNDGIVSNCCSTGDVIGEENIGGLVGYNRYGSASDCYSTGDVSGGYNVGGLMGINYKGSVSNCYSTGSISSIGPVGQDEQFEIGFGGLVGKNYDGSILNCYSTSDLDVDGGSWAGGLVGYNYNLGSILKCYSAGSVSGRNYIGGLVGINSAGGSISNCFSTGSVTGSSSVGGLVAGNHGDISSSFSTGDVTGRKIVGGLVGGNDNNDSVSNCYSTGDVNGKEIVGGLMGYNSGIVSNCYSAGDVSGDEDVGGLVGVNYSYGSISNSFWDIDIQTHGITESIGISRGAITNVSGLTTTEMQTESTFTDAGWDFITPIWTIEEGVYYPRLRWESPVLHAEPEITLWTSNTISWEPVVGAIEYYAECAEDANFDNIVYNSGWITETSYEFTGLQLGQQYWYRVKAASPAGMESKWSNVESSLQGTLAEAIEIVLETIDLKSENLKKPYIKKISIAQDMIESGNFTSALNKLENDILPETDGCAETGEPDDNDWVITCEGQSEVYPLIIETIEYVKSLMQ